MLWTAEGAALLLRVGHGPAPPLGLIEHLRELLTLRIDSHESGQRVGDRIERHRRVHGDPVAVLRDGLHLDGERGVCAEDHAVAGVLRRHGDCSEVLPGLHDLHACASIPAMTPGGQMDQIDLTAAHVTSLLAALVEAEQKRCLHGPPILGFLVGVVVAHISLRDLQGDLIGRLRHLNDEGRGRLVMHIALESPQLLEPRVAGDPARRVGNACHLWRS
mmetsp:Transcript_2310/g.5167  ORF Transcript_2310/g.5167 Transcript_2310/m.5167 type:complete len:218 (+) Transcript_2310:276-929(+)